MLVFSAIVPHPPLAISEIGHGQEKKLDKTKQAYSKIASKLAKTEPEVIIFITPHTLVYPDRFNICGMERLRGDFSQFGYKDYSWAGKNDLELASGLEEVSKANDVAAILYDNGQSEFDLDYGTLVPLYFFDQAIEDKYRVLPIGYANLSRAEHYQFGQLMHDLIQKSRKRIAVIASGDLSHRLNYAGPEGFNYEGESFDSQLIDLILRKKESEILDFDEDILEDAGECAYRSILMLLGVLSLVNYQPELYSYEGPFGVGHAVINMRV